MATKEKNFWILLVFLLSGLVIGGLIGQLTQGVSFLSWLSYGQTFGIADTVSLDLGVVKLTFGIMFNINISSIIGIIIAVFIYRKF